MPSFARGTPGGRNPAARDSRPGGAALEGLSPFSVAQLCYGYYYQPGASRLLVYAAYRRRFTVEDAEAWAEADAVLPAFAACLGLAPAAPAALLVTGPDFITAIGWDGSDAVPAVVRTRVIAADAPAGERAAVRAELVAQLNGFPPRSGASTD